MERRRDKRAAKRRRGGTGGASSPTLGVLDTDLDEAAIGASREQFCKYLVSARERSGKTLDEIATKTRIPKRSLERLETGAFEALPADVFVRGFLRSYARCVGLDEAEAIKRYSSCGMTPAPVASRMADELASAMATLEASAGPQLRAVPARQSGQQASSPEPIPPKATRSETRAETARPQTAKQTAKPTAPSTTPSAPSGTSSAPTEPPAVEPPAAAEPVAQAAVMPAVEPAIVAEPKESAPARADTPPVGEPVSQGEAVSQIARSASPRKTSSPSKSPRTARKKTRKRKKRKGTEKALTTATVSERNAEESVSEKAAAPSEARSDMETTDSAPRRTRKAARPVRPALRIDDANPEQAERERSEREHSEREDTNWKNFIPPALMDSEQGSRRGALTLAVIILVIVATLTMSYLMRQPDESGDGVTRADPIERQQSLG